MKTWMYMLLVTAVCCSSPEQPGDTFTPSPAGDSEWVTYEGRIPLNESNNLYFELSMRATNESGEGEFSLDESFEDTYGTATKLSSSKGYYATVSGQTPDERIVHLHNTALEEGVTLTYRIHKSNGNTKFEMIREEEFRTRDLVLKPSGKDKLLVLNDRMRIISEAPEHNLIRRLSKPFTIEGYFRHNGYSADFLEMNTGVNWHVSKSGDYNKAIKQYYLLTENKFDVTYLKGIAFPIQHTLPDGTRTEALMIRKVLQMTSAPALNRK